MHITPSVLRTFFWHACRLVVTASLLLVPSLAHAEPARDPAAAQLLFEQGRSALDKGEIDRACTYFSESERLDPAAGTLFNLASCEERQGKLASAWQHLREGIERLAPGDARSERAEQRARELESRVPRLTVRRAPSDDNASAHVFRDDIELTGVSLGLALPVNAGPHRILVRAPGHVDNAFTVTVADGEQQAVDARLGPPLNVTQVVPPAVEPHASHSKVRTFGFVSGSAGLLGLGLGTVAGLFAASAAGKAQGNCDTSSGACNQEGLDALDRAHAWGATSTVSFLAGAALLVTGALCILIPTRSAQRF